MTTMMTTRSTLQPHLAPKASVVLNLYQRLPLPQALLLLLLLLRH